MSDDKHDGECALLPPVQRASRGIVNDMRVVLLDLGEHGVVALQVPDVMTAEMLTSAIDDAATQSLPPKDDHS